MGKCRNSSSAFHGPVSAVVALILGATTQVLAATGSVLLQYDSALGTLPHRQGWTYLSRCLKDYCPSSASAECAYQGNSGNDCTLGHGCGPNATPVLETEWYNAPPNPLTVTGGCTYTEWIAFDDGQDYVEVAYPVGLPLRNLTFGPTILDTLWGPHKHPAFGAPGFFRGPMGHNAVRIVTGGGVPGVKTLPASSTSQRNTGRLNVRGTYTVPAGVTALTLVAKVAAGNRSWDTEMVAISGLGRRFALGVNGVDGSGTLGRFTCGGNSSTVFSLFGTRTVQVALAKETVVGPHQGEFFTVRVVLRNDGTVTAWLNDDPATIWTGTTSTASTLQVVDFHPDEQAGTMWLDSAKLFEGEVPPKCADPVFDVNHDNRVNSSDLANGLNGFVDCATGPAPPAGVFDSLSEQCRCLDVNDDKAIDMRDYAVFQQCLTAGDVPLDSACDD